MTKDEARLAVQDLVEKYDDIKAANKIRDFSEEDTKKDFILPLFEALGWDVSNRAEVTAEEQISGKRVDYGFYLNGFIKFYLEAKPLKTDKMHDDEYAQQAIRYSWNKGVTWAILSNFETTIVFNALSPDKSLFSKKYFEISSSEYESRFDQLWLLSKESFGQSLIDKEAEQHGKKAQKVSVTESLSKDMNECRGLLTKAFEIWNTGVDSHLIDEEVQKLNRQDGFYTGGGGQEDRTADIKTDVAPVASGQDGR